MKKELCCEIYGAREGGGEIDCGAWWIGCVREKECCAALRVCKTDAKNF